MIAGRSDLARVFALSTPFGHRMMYPDFKDMRDLIPLQAADIAYELHREFERRYIGQMLNLDTVIHGSKKWLRACCPQAFAPSLFVS
jgi:hypothetical protein